MIGPLVCLLLATQARGQEVAVEFEEVTDIVPFELHAQNPSSIIGIEPDGGVGGSGAIRLPGSQALTYENLSFAFGGHGAAVTTSAMFKTGDLAPPVGFNETIGQVYITSDPSGNPIDFFGTNDFFASVYRDSTGAYLGISGQTSTGSFWPFLETPIPPLQSNRWYELSATFTRNQQSTLDASFQVRDFGPNGTTAGPIMGLATSSFSGQSAAFADTTWFGGFGADADDGVTIDRFRIDVPGDDGGPQIVRIEPTYDVTYFRDGNQQFIDDEVHLSIDGGDSQFPVLKALMEFDLSVIPANADITAASLIIQPTFNRTMTLRALGYLGDGQLTSEDPVSLKFVLGQSTGTLQGGVENTILLGTNFIEAPWGPDPHMGLILESATAGPFVDIVASEASSGTPPTLVIEYTLPEANGDFDEDGDVDGADFLAWQRGDSPQPHSAADLADWRSNFGSAGSSATSVAVPEPAVWRLVWATLLGTVTRRSPTSRSGIRRLQ